MFKILITLATGKFTIKENNLNDELLNQKFNAIKEVYFMNLDISLVNQLVQEFIPCNTPNKNAHIESFNSIIELELFQVIEFKNYNEAYSIIHQFINFYNTKRIHGSLKMRTPQECLKIYESGGELNLNKITL